MYYICPLTGAVWLSRYTEDMRNTPIVYERTSCLQSSTERRTLAKCAVSLFNSKVVPNRPYRYYNEERVKDLVLNKWPMLPLEGLFFEDLELKTEVTWHCNDISVSTKGTLYLWLQLLAPLERGCSVPGWIASPLEAITRQVLQPGLRLEWWFGWGQIGEVEIQEQQEVSSAEFFDRFGFDKEYRETRREFSDWFDELEGHRRRRRR